VVALPHESSVPQIAASAITTVTRSRAMLTFRDAHPEDAPAIASLLRELGYPAEVGSVAGRLAGLLRRPDYAVCVAVDAGEVRGLGSMHVFPILHADEPLALVTALVVAESARGGGAGRGLVERLEQFARSHGCGRVSVTTANHRFGAHAFYEHLGYLHTGRRYAKEPL
jgi:GNAT superfamily N-acetyltransferase